MAYVFKGSNGRPCACPDPDPVPAQQQQSSPFWDGHSKVGLVLGIIVSIRSWNE